MSVFKAKNITKRYGKTDVLTDVSFAVEKGDICVIIGPNGAGKSTMMKMLLGLEQPSEGTIEVYGGSPEQARTKIGYVPQRFTVDPQIPITVEEFLSLSAEVGKLRRAKKAIAGAMEALGITEIRGSELHQISGGQLQRVMIARALMFEKECILLDEPIAGIDVEGQQALYELMLNLNKERGITFVVISHELDVVFRYATTVLCLNQKMLCHGAPDHVLTADVLTNMYGDHHDAHYHHGC